MDVAGKSVRIVESHEQVLGDWAEAAHAAGGPLTLVTLDRHTDTTRALTSSLTSSLTDGDEDGSEERLHRRSERILARYRGRAPAELEPLVERLQNDEHIDAALRLGVLDRALIISSQAGCTGDAPLDGAHVYRPVCAPDCVETSHGGAACERRRFDAMLESSLLAPALVHLGFDVAAPPPYVLDIDLDTFATRKGLAPADASTFHALLAGAQMLTIAREPEYVAESLDDHDSDEIEAAIGAHVRRAMASCPR